MNGLVVPPQSEDAERGVVGSLLLDPMAAYGKAFEAGVRSDSFFDPRHGVLFSAVGAMVAEGLPVDALTLVDWLGEGLERAGGLDYLEGLLGASPVPAHVEHYGRIVVEKKVRRRVIELATRLVEDAYGQDGSAEDLVRSVPQRFSELISARRSRTNQEVLDEWYEEMLAIKRGERRNGLALPWTQLDMLLGGLEPGLILVGARPSAGKTTLEVNLCDYVARHGVSVARACLDMSKKQLLVRSVIRESRVSLPKMKKGFARWNQMATVQECKDLVASWPQHVIEETDLDGVLSMARVLKLKHDIGLLTVDFAQLIVSGIPHLDSNMNALMGVVTKKLKALAFELGIPVVLLSQLNRGSDKDDRKPRLSDLRDSGNLEQNATQVLLMSKARQADLPGYDKSTNPTPLPEDAEKRYLRAIVVEVAKNQNGETGDVEMWMRPNYFRFQEAESVNERFSDLGFRMAEFSKDTREDEVCDIGDPCVMDVDEGDVDEGVLL